MKSKRDESFSMLDPRNQTGQDEEFRAGMESHFPNSLGTNMDRLRNFAKFVPRQSLAGFLARHELFRRILGIHGHIIECGVFLGGGVMTWGQLSAIYEPVNHIRRVVGFDTFRGFAQIGKNDAGDSPAYAAPGGLAVDSREDLNECIRLFDLNRPLGHIPRIELVAGDAVETIPAYVAANPHLVIALLYLDFDLYDPTRVAIQNFLPRMPKGAILAFDELAQAAWPGETLALMETIGIRNLRIERFPFTPQLSFAQLE